MLAVATTGGPLPQSRVALTMLFANHVTWVCTNYSNQKGELVLVEILIVLLIIAVALFIWRNVAGRRI